MEECRPGFRRCRQTRRRALLASLLRLGWTSRLATFRKNDGRGDWIRTSDLHTPSVMRYQAALRPDLAAASRQGYLTRQGASGNASGSAAAKRQSRQVGWAAADGAARGPLAFPL